MLVFLLALALSWSADQVPFSAYLAPVTATKGGLMICGFSRANQTLSCTMASQFIDQSGGDAISSVTLTSTTISGYSYIVPATSSIGGLVFSKGFTGESVSASSLIASLFAGTMQVTVKTANAPNGAARGSFTQASDFTAVLRNSAFSQDGSQLFASTASSAVGAMTLSYNPTTMNYDGVLYHTVIGASAIEIRSGSTAIQTIPVASNTATVSISARDLFNFQQNRIWIVVTSSVYTVGEIAGFIEISNSVPFLRMASHSAVLFNGAVTSVTATTSSNGAAAFFYDLGNDVFTFSVVHNLAGATSVDLSDGTSTWNLCAGDAAASACTGSLVISDSSFWSKISQPRSVFVVISVSGTQTLAGYLTQKYTNYALLSSDQMQPRIDSAGAGVAVLRFDPASKVLSYAIAHTLSCTSVTLRRGDGRSWPLTSGSCGSFINGSLALTANEAAPIAEMAYSVTVETSANVNGEIGGTVKSSSLLPRLRWPTHSASLSSGACLAALEFDWESGTLTFSAASTQSVSSASFSSSAGTITLPIGIVSRNLIGGTVQLSTAMQATLEQGTLTLNIGSFSGSVVTDETHSAIALSQLEAAPVDTNAVGVVLFSYVESTRTLSFSAVHSSAQINELHIHGPDSYKVILVTSPTASSTSGSTVLSARGAAYLKLGQLYVNLHSNLYTGGEMRGDIRISQTTGYIDRASYHAFFTSTVSGAAVFALNPITGRLFYNIQFLNGPATSIVISDLNQVENDIIPLGLTSPVVGVSYVSATQIAALNAGAFSISISGSTGVALSTTSTHFAVLEGELESPPTYTSSRGIALFFLYGSQLGWRVFQSVPAATGVHLHGSDSYKRVWCSSTACANMLAGSQELLADDFTALAQGQYYVNVHTGTPGTCLGYLRAASAEPIFNARPFHAVIGSSTAGYALGIFDLDVASGQFKWAVQHNLATGSKLVLTGPNSFSSVIGSATSLTLSGETVISDVAVGYALAGTLQVAIQTSNSPSGDISGTLATTQHFTALIRGQDISPAVTTASRGVAVFWYGEEDNILQYEIMHSFTDAQFITIQGPDSFSVALSNPTTVPMRGAVLLPNGMVSALKRNSLSLNVRTAIYTNGAAAGIVNGAVTSSIALNKRPSHSCTLSGSGGSGFALLNYDHATRELHYDILVSSTTSTSVRLADATASWTLTLAGGSAASGSIVGVVKLLENGADANTISNFLNGLLNIQVIIDSPLQVLMSGAIVSLGQYAALVNNDNAAPYSKLTGVNRALVTLSYSSSTRSLSLSAYTNINPAQVSINGPNGILLPVSTSGSPTLSGSVTLSVEQESFLQMGLLYLTFGTAKGWIVEAGVVQPTLYATHTSVYTSSLSGGPHFIGLFSFDQTTLELKYHIVHNIAYALNAETPFEIVDQPSNNVLFTLAGTRNPSIGSVTLDHTMLASLSKTGASGLFLRVRNTAYTEKISIYVSSTLESKEITHTAIIEGSNVQPVVTTAQRAAARFSFDTRSLLFEYRIVHNFQTNPSTVLLQCGTTLQLPFSSGTSPITGSTTLSASVGASVVAGSCSITLTIVANPNGAATGRVLPVTKLTTYVAPLPVAVTPSTGFLVGGPCEPGTVGCTYSYTYNNASTTSLTTTTISLGPDGCLSNSTTLVCSGAGLCDPRPYPPQCVCDLGYGGFDCSEPRNIPDTAPIITTRTTLGGGAIAGIIIGAILFIAIVAIVAYLIYKRRDDFVDRFSRGPSTNVSVSMQEMPPADEGPIYTPKPARGAAPPSAKKAVPYPWEENTSDDGTKFYYNVETGESVWELPK